MTYCTSNIKYHAKLYSYLYYTEYHVQNYTEGIDLIKVIHILHNIPPLLWLLVFLDVFLFCNYFLVSNKHTDKKQINKVNIYCHTDGVSSYDRD